MFMSIDVRKTQLRFALMQTSNMDAFTGLPFDVHYPLSYWISNSLGIFGVIILGVRTFTSSDD